MNLTILSMAGAALLTNMAFAQNITSKIPSGKSTLDVNEVMVMGSGCRGFSSAKVMEDGSWLLIQPNNFTNEILDGGGIPIKACNISANINYVDNNASESYQYRVDEVYLPYRISLGNDVNLDITNKTFIQGNTADIASEKITLKGKQKAYGYLITEHSSMGWSKCGGGRSLTLNISTKLTKGNDDKALGTLEIASTSPIFIKLAWQKCTP